MGKNGLLRQLQQRLLTQGASALSVPRGNLPRSWVVRFARASRKRRGVLNKSEKSSANTETGEDGLAVPAAAKGAIDVGLVFTDVESCNDFFE